MGKELKNRLVYRIHDRELHRYANRFLKGRLIDIGCGTKPYAEMLASYVTEHVGIDQEQSSHDRSNVDLFGTAYEFPVSNESFDSVSAPPSWRILKSRNGRCVNVFGS